MISKRSWIIKSGLAFGISLIMIAESHAAVHGLKSGEVVSAATCRSSPQSCVCGPGTLPRDFIGEKGRHFITCVRVACEQGQELRETVASGGRIDAHCVELKDVPHKKNR
ncbi:MAG: hypothetical protein ACXWP5_02005 [Bdellovibrionota bacterium]